MTMASSSMKSQCFSQEKTDFLYIRIPPGMYQINIITKL